MKRAPLGRPSSPKLERWRTLDQFQFRQKVSSFLARRGFGHDVVRLVVERAWQELHDDNSNDLD